MRLMLTSFFTLVVASTAGAHTVLTRKIHTDSYTQGEQTIPAKDTTQIIVVAKDRMRVETEEATLILRLDQNKMYLLDATQKVANVIDLPYDIVKNVPAEMAAAMQRNATTAVVTPQSDTKKIGEWNVRRYQVVVSSPAGFHSTEDVWTTKDLAIDLAAYQQMARVIGGLRPGGIAMADELKKLDGVTVLADRVSTRNGVQIKSHEELSAAQEKDVAGSAFEVPEDYQQRPFDPMANIPGRSAPVKK